MFRLTTQTGPLCGESIDDRWIPLTKGQLCWRRFYVMTSSYHICTQLWHRVICSYRYISHIKVITRCCYHAIYAEQMCCGPLKVHLCCYINVYGACENCLIEIYMIDTRNCRCLLFPWVVISNIRVKDIIQKGLNRNGRYFEDEILKQIFFRKWKMKPALVQKMDECYIGDSPLAEHMLTKFCDNIWHH